MLDQRTIAAVAALSGALLIWPSVAPGVNPTLTTAVDIAEVRDGDWHHLALTQSGWTVSLHLDGEVVGTRTFPSEGAAPMPPWHVMNNGTFAEQYSAGEADEVAIYAAALGGTEIAEHYRLGRGP